MITGIIGVQIIKRTKLNDFHGEPIIIKSKEAGRFRYLIGGSVFGLGWGLVGTCPGPVFVLIGAGFYPVIIILIGALAGTFLYGVIKDKLPH